MYPSVFPNTIHALDVNGGKETSCQAFGENKNVSRNRDDIYE
ncbi:hypothetical protein [Rhizobium etli]|nr:hypothetical protein [Rhizobium etli]